MKIAIRGGHNYGVPGASGILNEVAEDRKIYVKVIEYLKKLGHEVLDVTPNKTSTSAEDLYFGVSKANSWGADYFCSIHLNAGGGQGTEVLYYNGSSKGKLMAAKIASKIAELGFTNRGAKIDTRGLYELRSTRMPANIIEVCFVDSNVDAALYRKVGVSKIAKAIAEGITGQTIKVETEVKGNKYTVNYCLEFQKWYNKITQTRAPLTEDGVYGPATEEALQKIINIIREF
ncbi:N-acetylmuramoyl-L-alanine amidase [Clostridium sp.]|jgi:N-acetylmuramoyl-L-alanine amidase|uniref:N-acetylmuramoyl-L-alanine amidase n=1 Tax=Clostridium sp. TaxID=1506 RepID=UPI0039F52A00